MSLLALQRDFRTWLTTETQDVAARLDRSEATGPSIYLNNYRGSLMSCLSASYPKTLAWLGASAFEGAAATHVDRVHPHSWTLDAYAVDFPATLDRLYPDDPEVAELARLETALDAVFVGEDAAPVEPATLAGLDWDRAVLAFVPTLKILAVATNAADIWSALADDEPLPAAARLPEPGHLIVWRQDFVPRFRRIASSEAQIIGQIAEGVSFGSICNDLAESLGHETGPDQAGQLLGQWLAAGLVHSVTDRVCGCSGERPAGCGNPG